MAFRSRNDLRVRGTIVFIRSGETGAGVPFVNIRIVTDSGPRKDYPMFRFYGESATIAAKFERGDRVLVTGHASLRRKLDENRQPTNGYQQLLIGDSIEMSKRYGVIYVDADDEGNGTFKRIKKDSFHWYKKCIESDGKDLD